MAGRFFFHPAPSEARPEAVIGPLKKVLSILMTRLKYCTLKLNSENSPLIVSLLSLVCYNVLDGWYTTLFPDCIALSTSLGVLLCMIPLAPPPSPIMNAPLSSRSEPSDLESRLHAILPSPFLYLVLLIQTRANFVYGRDWPLGAR